MPNTKRRKGFTLIELLVVIAIIAILIALLLPAVQQAREAARRTECKDNLHNIGIALHNYHETNNMFPPANVCRGGGTSWNCYGWTWQSKILPFAEQKPLWDRVKTTAGSDSNNSNQTLANRAKIKIYRCPSHPDPGTNGWTSYNAMGGSSIYGCSRSLNCRNYNGIFRHNTCTAIRDILDGTTNTIIVGEVVDDGGPLTRGAPRRQNFSSGGDGNPPNQNGIEQYMTSTESNDPPNSNGDEACASYHPGGCHVLMAGGEVHFISENIGISVWTAMGTRAGGEVRNFPF